MKLFPLLVGITTTIRGIPRTIALIALLYIPRNYTGFFNIRHNFISILVERNNTSLAQRYYYTISYHSDLIGFRLLLGVNSYVSE